MVFRVGSGRGMTVTSFKLTSAGRNDRRKRINGSYSNISENRQMISRAVTAYMDLFSSERIIQPAIEGSHACLEKKTVGKQRFR